jgi:hypothetical protein
MSSDTSIAVRGNPGRYCGEILMKRSLFVAAALLSVVVGASYAQAQTATAEPNSRACSAALNALNLSWEDQGFDTPSKPAQMRVSGADGNAISGQAYGYVTDQMRLAAGDEQRGDFTACLKSVRQAQADLPSPTTA